MTAEEYIENKSTEDFGNFDIDLQENTKLGTYSIYKEDAIKAIDMARQEEREKAVKAFDEAIEHMDIIGNMFCFNDAKIEFEKLLNK